MKILLISYDNGMFINTFPLGLAYVAATMRKQNHIVKVWCEDFYHDLIDIYEGWDAVGLGMCGGYYQYKKLKEIRARIPQMVPLWLGGHMVSAEPEYFKSKFNVVPFIGEYDYSDDLDSIPWPKWEFFPVDYYAMVRLPHAGNHDRCFPVISSRGCPYRCNFCYRMNVGYRLRSPESVVEEIQYLKLTYNITYIEFMDELFMISPDRVMEMCEALKPLKIKWWCNGRLNIAKPKILQAMKDAGCVFINYGVESVDNKVLENMHKDLTSEQIIKGTEATLEAGISPGLNMIWGNLGDTPDTLKRSAEFLLKYDDQAQLRTIRPVTPYPGTELFDIALKKGLVEDVEDFYERKHKNSDLLTVNFTGLADREFHSYLWQWNQALIRNYYNKKRDEELQVAWDLYFNQNVSFRGFRQT